MAEQLSFTGDPSEWADRFSDWVQTHLATKAALAQALGTHLDLFQRIVIGTCSVSAVAYSPFGPVVLTVNSTGASLAELRPS